MRATQEHPRRDRLTRRRAWAVGGRLAREAGSALADLNHLGAVPPAHHKDLDLELPRGLTYDDVELRRRAEGTTARLRVQVSDDGVVVVVVVVDLTFDGARPACHRRRQ